MKTRTLIIMLMLALMPAVSNAQIGGMLKKGASKVLGSVGKAASKEANKEIDSLAQKQADKAVENAVQNAKENNQEGQEDQNTGRSGKGLNLGNVLGGKTDIKHNDEYKFDGMIVMKVEIYDKEGTTTMDYNMHFSKTLPNAAMVTKNITDTKGESVPVAAVTIMDGENKCFMMLTDVNNSKMGIIGTVPDEETVQEMEGKSGQPVTPPSITKTGNTRTIAGLKCEEYIVREADEKDYTKMWFTKDNALNIDSRIWTKANMPSAYGYKDFAGGMIMAFETYDENNKLTAKSEVTEINKSYPYSVSTVGYGFIKMNFNQMQNKNQNK
jgi:hypothetical protein